MIKLTKKQAVIISILLLAVIGFVFVQAYYLGVRNEANYFTKINMTLPANP